VTPQEKKQVVSFNDKLTQTMDIRLTTSADTRSQELEHFCRELVENASRLQVMIEKNDTAGSMPGIHITSSLVYHAVPLGTELLPFLDMLVDISEQSAGNSPAGSTQESELPAKLKLYVSNTCSFCPAVIRKLVPLAMQNTHIQLMIIDAVLFSEVADTDHIRSVPTLILDDQFRWTGMVDLDELLNTIQGRDPAQLSAGSLASMISDGNAYGLAEMMLKEGFIFPGFMDLLTHDAFSTRLGAMAAAEEIAERQMSLAVQMAQPLVERFEKQIDAVKGDLLYILGLSGDSGTLDFLKKVASGEYPEDIKEAAAEAMEAIQSR